MCTSLFISVCFSVPSKYICVSICLSVCLSVSTLSLPIPLSSLLPYLPPFPHLSSRCLSISVCLSVYLISPQPSFFSSSLCLSSSSCLYFSRGFSLFVSLFAYPFILYFPIPISPFSRLSFQPLSLYLSFCLSIPLHPIPLLLLYLSPRLPPHPPLREHLQKENHQGPLGKICDTALQSLSLSGGPPVYHLPKPTPGRVEGEGAGQGGRRRVGDGDGKGDGGG